MWKWFFKQSLIEASTDTASWVFSKKYCSDSDAFLHENALKLSRHQKLFQQIVSSYKTWGKLKEKNNKEKIQEILIFLIIKFSFDFFLHKNIFIIEKKIRRNFQTWYFSLLRFSEEFFHRSLTKSKFIVEE
jgi:hypothetical protein